MEGNRARREKSEGDRIEVRRWTEGWGSGEGAKKSGKSVADAGIECVEA